MGSLINITVKQHLQALQLFSLCRLDIKHLKFVLLLLDSDLVSQNVEFFFKILVLLWNLFTVCVAFFLSASIWPTAFSIGSRCIVWDSSAWGLLFFKFVDDKLMLFQLILKLHNSLALLWGYLRRNSSLDWLFIIEQGWILHPFKEATLVDAAQISRHHV